MDSRPLAMLLAAFIPPAAAAELVVLGCVDIECPALQPSEGRSSVVCESFLATRRSEIARRDLLLYMTVRFCQLRS